MRAMKFMTLLAGVVVAFVAWPKAAQLGVAKPPAKAVTSWGDPDISGLFTTDDELGVPFERPAQFGDRQYVSAEEFAQRQSQSARQDEADREEFVAPRAQQTGGPV